MSHKQIHFNRASSSGGPNASVCCIYTVNDFEIQDPMKVKYCVMIYVVCSQFIVVFESIQKVAFMLCLIKKRSRNVRKNENQKCLSFLQKSLNASFYHSYVHSKILQNISKISFHPIAKRSVARRMLSYFLRKYFQGVFERECE